MKKYRILSDNCYGGPVPEIPLEYKRKYTIEKDVVSIAKHLYDTLCKEPGQLITISVIEKGEWRPSGITFGGQHKDGDGNLIENND